jgi:hypothetical protein
MQLMLKAKGLWKLVHQKDIVYAASEVKKLQNLPPEPIVRWFNKEDMNQS